MSAQENPNSQSASDKKGSSEKEPGRPNTPAPQGSTGRTELIKKQLRALKPTMVSQSVNKTALHPGGVQ